MAKSTGSRANLPKKVFRKAAEMQKSEGMPRRQALAVAANMNRAGRLTDEGAYVRKRR